MKRRLQDPLQRIEIVLVRPLRPGNIGAVARAMKNMGLSRLVLVDPSDHFALGRSSEAYQMAYGANEILDRVRAAKTLLQAVSRAGLVVGTTVRHHKGYGRLLPLPQVVPEILSCATRQRVAVVFGSERTGLTNDEIALCQRLVVIPTGPAFPSLNLAQAVIVVLYELFRGSQKKATPPGRAPDRLLAPSKELERFYDDLEQLLIRIGFVKGRQGRFILTDLRRIFGRSGLDSREVRILRGILRQIRWAER
ncbi:MAG: RNA methyltransferase [Nitrospiria bacterium]